MSALPALSNEQWPTVLDCLSEWMGEGMPLEVGIDRLREKWGMREDDLASIQWRLRRYEADKRRALKEADLPLHPNAAEMMPAASHCRLPEGQLAMLFQVVEYVFGVSLLNARTFWKPGRNTHLRDGDTWQEHEGEGRGWTACAVEVRRATGEVEWFPECRVRAVDRQPIKGRKYRLIHMAELCFEGETLNEKEISRRLAAFKFAYFGPSGSGVKSAVHLATAAGVSKQAISARLKFVREKHDASTGEGGDRLHGSVPARGRRMMA